MNNDITIKFFCKEHVTVNGSVEYVVGGVANNTGTEWVFFRFKKKPNKETLLAMEYAMRQTIKMVKESYSERIFKSNFSIDMGEDE